MYTQILRKILLPLGDLASRNRVMHFYRLFSNLQWWERAKLKQYQSNRLLETLKTVYSEVPFYRELYDKYGVKIKDIKGIEDLHMLPIITKDDLRRSYPEKCTRKTKWPWREYCTSGSSGKPFAVRVDNYSLSQARALMLLRANFSGWNIGDPYIQTGMTLNRGFVKRTKDILLGTHYLSAFDQSDKMLDSCLEMMERRDLKFVMGYAASLYCIAKRASEVGFCRTMRGIVSWGDNMYDHYRSKIEDVFQCRVTDTYGCGEGIQIAAQCGINKGEYHIFMPHVAVEVVDDEGYPVRTGDMGHIVLTRLDPGVMPLIRYKVGDVGRMSPNDSCPCGRGLEMLSKIEGRDTDVVITPNGNRLIVHFFTGIFEYYQSVDTFKVTQSSPDSILVEIVPKPEFRMGHWEQIKNEILEKGDPALNIDFKLVREIELEKSNKRRFVVSTLNQRRRD